MANARDEGIGTNLRMYRTLAGLTQEQLAVRTGYTRNYISMIEAKKRLITKFTVLEKLATALGVTPYDLNGQPYTATDPTDYERLQIIPQIRLALDDLEDPPAISRSMGEIELAVDKAMIARMHCAVPALGEHLPQALIELRYLWFNNGDQAAAKLLVKAAVTGSLAVKAAGWLDLAVRLAQLAFQVASTDGDPVSLAAARFAVAQCALSEGKRPLSARLAADGANELDRLTRRAGTMPPSILNDVFGWMTMLHLHASLAESGLDGGDPQGHLDTAASIARRVQGNPWHMEPTTANVDVWRVANALENDEPDLAPQLARRVNVQELLTPQRIARLYLDAGRGAAAADDHDEAVKYLLLSDRAAPGDLRQRPTAVELVRHLVQDSGARRSEDLQLLAVRVGVVPT